LTLDIEAAFTEAFLVTLDHHEYDLLVVVWALEEVLKVALLLDFFLRLLDLVQLLLLGHVLKTFLIGARSEAIWFLIIFILLIILVVIFFILTVNFDLILIFVNSGYPWRIRWLLDRGLFDRSFLG
jgi:hypothetical protein